jgi:hypothetical protein
MLVALFSLLIKFVTYTFLYKVAFSFKLAIALLYKVSFISIKLIFIFIIK